MDDFEITGGPLGGGGSSKRPREDDEGSGSDEEQPDLKQSRVETNIDAEVTSTIPDVPPAPAPDPFKKRRLVLQIKAYAARFPTRVEGLDLNSVTLESKNEEELDALLKEVRFMVACFSTSSIANIGINTGVAIYQEACLACSLQVPDLRIALERDKEWQDLKAEMELELSSWMDQPLWMRVCAKVAQTTYVMHMAYSNQGNKAPRDTEQVNQDLLKQLNNL
jgi:hypothetical protein